MRQDERIAPESRMLFKLKSRSKAVHHQHEEQWQHIPEDHSRTDESSCTSLTVWRKSLLMSCKGFTVIGSEGNLAYRVDNYIGRPEELVLMDASGNSVLTMQRRTKFGIAESWSVYEGEMDCNGTKEKSQKNPTWCVRKNVKILQANPSNVLAFVYREASDKRHAYVIQGSYAHRCCKVLDQTKRTVAEIKPKEAMSRDVSFGVEVFQLVVQPNFDSGFAMALVLLLDQMFS